MLKAINQNPFLFDYDETYVRDLDIVENTKALIAQAMAKYRNVSYKRARAWVEEKIDTLFPLNSPNMNVLRREPGLDRRKEIMDFVSYLDHISKEGHILAPNMVVYAHPDKVESFMSGFINDNLKNRSKVKKLGQEAAIKGNLTYADFCNILQNNFKFRNNSISGATSSPHNPLYYGTLHTTLTSTTRVMTSTANSLNERMLASNRHYFTPDVVLENIAYTTYAADLDKIQNAIDLYDMKIPTPEYIMAMIEECTRHYFRDEANMERIRKVVYNLNYLERCAFAFCSDLHALCEVNDKIMRRMFMQLAKLPHEGIENPEAAFAAANDDMISMMGCVGYKELRGKTVKDVKKEEPELYSRLGAYLAKVQATFEEFRPLIQAFFVTSIMPQHLFEITGIVRKAVVGSDTDSSIFSAHNQVKWFTGTEEVTEFSIPVTGIASYIISQHVVHHLAMYSAQMNVKRDELYRAAMKSEFIFPTFAVTNKSKHYSASKAVCEGSVYKELKYEIKGVNLKNSKLPPDLRIILQNFQEGLLKLVAENRQLTVPMLLSVIAKIEHAIIGDMRQGSASWFKSVQVKTETTYAKPEIAIYRYVPWWNAVFGPKYGYIEQLPCAGIAVNVALPKKQDIDIWFETLPADMAARARQQLAVQGFKNFTQMIVPRDLLNSNGKLPVEITSAIDVRKILKTMMQPFYLTLSAFGIHMLDKKISILASDIMDAEQAERHLWMDFDLSSMLISGLAGVEYSDEELEENDDEEEDDSFDMDEAA